MNRIGLRKLQALLAVLSILSVWSAPLSYAESLTEEYEEDGDLMGSSQTQVHEDPRVSGEIVLEDTTEHKSNAYLVNQDQAIQYFEKLEKLLVQARAGSSVSAPLISEGALLYLTGAYLYCSVNNGVCPFILDGILESDLLNSSTTGSAACPNMTQFWKIWLKNDMEQRHKYLVKTGFLQLTSEFRQNSRPKYLKCKETIQNELASTQLAQRFSVDSEKVKAVSKLVLYLKGLSKTVPNVFVATGAQQSSSLSSSAGASKGTAPQQKARSRN